MLTYATRWPDERCTYQLQLRAQALCTIVRLSDSGSPGCEAALIDINIAKSTDTIVSQFRMPSVQSEVLHQ